MANLWAYGDSFIERYTQRGWVDMVAKHFDLKIRNHGLHGTSLSYTYYQILKTYQKFQPNDVVIIVLTDINRAWLHEDQPSVSHITTVESKYTDKKDLDWFYRYWGYHHNLLAESANLHNFIEALVLKTQHLNIKPIIFYAFDSGQEYYHYNNKLNHAIGYLFDISINEFIGGESAFQKIGLDRRTNHLSETNHQILATKIIDSIEQSIPIDLQTGFVKQII